MSATPPPTSGVTLGIDTSTEVVVGLARGGTALGERRCADPRRHVEDLLPLIIDLTAEHGLRPADLDQVVVGLGPGPFTGLRVGVATARTLAHARGIRLVGVCGLDVIARSWVQGRQPPTQEFLVLTDARRREVYWARYRADGTRVEGPAVGPAASLPALVVAGPAAALAPQLMLGAGAPQSLSGEVLAAAGPGLPDVGSEPLYLRRPDAAEPSGRKSVLAVRRSRR